ncbi:response regulator transcription factor [Sphingomonas bacterium]|uniref:response regulator n=1 Tax=Sphingomonas bacterium TaxID=1895847 RepID=UPI001577540A|nr:response regulator transcription factor [Sphingomonas bacterium]
MRLLLVEDDTALADALRNALERRGIASDHAANASDAGQMLTVARYAAVVLDIGLPDRSGIEVLRALRGRDDPIPVVLLTARGELGDRIEGLNAGADDYLVKPFAVEELVARLKAVRRRQGAFQGSVLRFANVRFDTDSRDVLADDRPVALSAREMELLALLMRRGGQVVAKRLVEDQLYGLTGKLGSNAVEVYVHRLRRKIEDAGATVRIETIRGVGYMLRATS